MKKINIIFLIVAFVGGLGFGYLWVENIRIVREWNPTNTTDAFDEKNVNWVSLPQLPDEFTPGTLRKTGWSNDKTSESKSD